MLDRKTSTAWQYKLEALDLDPIDAEEELTEIGNQGWELVQILPNPTSGGPKYLCLFKRASD